MSEEEIIRIRLEAYEEFAERLKVYGYQPFNWNRFVVEFKSIDKCLQDMKERDTK